MTFEEAVVVVVVVVGEDGEDLVEAAGVVTKDLKGLLRIWMRRWR